jgi:hypothetical protein
MRRTKLTGAAIWVLLVTFGGQPAFSQSAPSDSEFYRRYDSGGADLRFDPNYDRTGVNRNYDPRGVDRRFDRAHDDQRFDRTGLGH